MLRKSAVDTALLYGESSQNETDFASCGLQEPRNGNYCGEETAREPIWQTEMSGVTWWPEQGEFLNGDCRGTKTIGNGVADWVQNAVTVGEAIPHAGGGTPPTATTTQTPLTPVPPTSSRVARPPLFTPNPTWAKTISPSGPRSQ